MLGVRPRHWGFTVTPLLAELAVALIGLAGLVVVARRMGRRHE